MESDVYELAIVIYEVKFHKSISSCPRTKTHVGFLGSDGGTHVLGGS
jgi:hypothetical protein